MQIAQIRARAREALFGNLSVTLAATLLYYGIYLLALQLITPSFQGAASLVFYQVGSFAVSLLAGLLLSGLAHLYLHLVYDGKPKVSHLFHGFREEPNKAIIIQAVHVGISLVCNLPLLLYGLAAGEAVHLGIYLLLQLVQFVLTFVCSAPIALSFFLLQDFPERGVRFLLAASIRLMRGNLRRYLLLAASFVPLALVSCLTLFVPFLWLLSYFRAAEAVFYQDLVASRANGAQDNGS